jgi:hypothetical protein
MYLGVFLSKQRCNSCAYFPLLVLCSFRTYVQENLISLCKTLNYKVLEGERLNVHIYMHVVKGALTYVRKEMNHVSILL